MIKQFGTGFAKLIFWEMELNEVKLSLKALFKSMREIREEK